jgi:hypothetical protein
MIEIADLSIRRSLRSCRPRTPKQLRGYVGAVLGFVMSSKPLVPGHAAPLDYLVHSFFEEREPRDCIVWANRGGGKTQLSAIATLLDLLFKPGIQVRILAGSFEQSSKMYRYLRRFLEDDLFNDLVAGNITGRHVELANGSRVEVLAQSERAVRGQRVHRLRCDEVELVQEEVWDAAQFVTRSGWCGGTYVRASIEALSTMHVPFGLMQKLIRSDHRKVFLWNVLDTLERCPPERACDPCRLWVDCGGRAKSAEGFVSIEDAIRQRDRTSDTSWRAEMLCEEPSRSDSVYPEFDPRLHVVDRMHVPPGALWIGGMDFGFRAPTVLLWAFEAGGIVHVIDELHAQLRTVEEHIAAAAAKPWPRPIWIGADPAGHQRSDQTGISTITLWKRAGWPLRAKQSRLQAGIELVRRRLLGPPVVTNGECINPIGLRIHARCVGLIRSLTMYHYPPNDERSLTPVKGEFDHAADALRYLIVHLDVQSSRAEVKRYSCRARRREPVRSGSKRR